MSGRFEETSVRPVLSEKAPRLLHTGEGPDPTAAAAAFPDFCGGVIEKKLPRKLLFSWNHTAVSQNGEKKSFFMSYLTLYCISVNILKQKALSNLS